MLRLSLLVQLRTVAKWQAKSEVLNFKINQRNMHLLQKQAFINGVWCDAKSNTTFDVVNPANGNVIGSVPDMDVSDVEKAIDSAYSAFHSAEWQNKTAKERSQLLKVR